MSSSFTISSAESIIPGAVAAADSVSAAAAAFLEAPGVRAAIYNLAIEILRAAPQDFQSLHAVSQEACSHLMEALIANSESLSSRASSPASSSCCCDDNHHHLHHEEEHHQVEPQEPQPPLLPPGGGHPRVDDDDGAPPAKITANTSFFTTASTPSTTTTTRTTTTTTTRPAEGSLDLSNNNNSNNNNQPTHQDQAEAPATPAMSSFASMSERASKTISDIQNGTAEFAAKTVLPRLTPAATVGVDFATIVEDAAATAASVILTITAANVKRLESYIMAECNGSEDGQRLADSLRSECTEIVFETIQLLASYLERHGVTPEGAVAIADAAQRRVTDLVRQRLLEQQQQDRAIPCGAEDSLDCDEDAFPAQQVPC